MDFTREPIIETVITPKEGCKIVVRSSKNVGQEEYFVDALEVVSFGSAIFYRSLEKPKAFLVPATDYEILEVREARMVLKNVGLDRAIKIGGGREKTTKEISSEKTDGETFEESTLQEEQAAPSTERLEKKRDRRRQQRRRRGRDEQAKEELVAASETTTELDASVAEAVLANEEKKPVLESIGVQVPPSGTFLGTLLPPPPTLISETIKSYKENVLFKNAFYNKDEETKEGEPTPEGVEKELDAPLRNEEVPPPFVSFWDDITQTTMPPLPDVEETEGEAPTSHEISEEENKK